MMDKVYYNSTVVGVPDGNQNRHAMTQECYAYMQIVDETAMIELQAWHRFRDLVPAVLDSTHGKKGYADCQLCTR